MRNVILLKYQTEQKRGEIQALGNTIKFIMQIDASSELVDEYQERLRIAHDEYIALHDKYIQSVASEETLGQHH
jgi:hypothetical protein